MEVTMRLMQLVEIMNQDNPNPWPSNAEMIEYARPKIFNFDYTFFDDSKKQQFETQFIKHFYDRALGFETPALWMFKLEECLNLILPYYNELYKSQLLDFEPFQDMFYEEIYNKNLTTESNGTIDDTDSGKRDITRDNETTQNGTDKKTGTDKIDSDETLTDTVNHTGNVDETTSNTNKYSDTPQGLATNQDYLTNMTTDSGNKNTENNLTDTENRNTNASSTTTYNTNVEKTNNGTENETIGETTSNTKNRTSQNMEKAIEDYTINRKGLSGKYSYMELLQQLRNTYINVTQMIFNDIYVKSLFYFIL